MAEESGARRGFGGKEGTGSDCYSERHPKSDQGKNRKASFGKKSASR